MKTYFKTVLFFILALSLSACGFALRQPQVLAPALENMYINTSIPNDPFVQTLQRVLIANNVNIVDDPKQATSTLNILSVATNNNMNVSGGISVSGFYTASLIVQFSVTDTKGNYLIAPNVLQQSQNFTSNATQVLSGNLMTAQLTSQMDQTIAQSIVNQLVSVHNNDSSS